MTKWRGRLLIARVLLVFAALGPGFITANVDNDAGGIYTYAVAGSQFGYKLLWTLIPMAIALAVAQEICARMGVVTGKGLAELIREEYGFRIAFFLVAGVILVDFGNVVAEFAGVASSLELFGISKYLSVPAAALFVWSLVLLGNYSRTEKIFLFASFLYLAYIASAVLAGPDWLQAAKHTVTPPTWNDLKDHQYLYLSIGLIGATIAPWQQFYLQSSVVDKGLRPNNLKMSQLDAVIGAVFSIVIAGFIIIASAATLHAHGIFRIESAADAARSFQPLAGKYAATLFAVGLLNASLFAAAILPLSTAYTVCGALGVESGLDKKLREAPFFYWLYTGIIVAGAGVILIPRVPLVRLAVVSQVINGVQLPLILGFMLLLSNKPDLMHQFKNSRSYNAIAWVIAGIIAILSLAALVSS